MHFGFENRKPKKETDIIFVLEGGSILSGIVNIEHHKRPHFIYSTENSLSLQKKIDAKRLEDLMISGLKNTAEEISREGFVTAKKKFHSENVNIHVFLGSLWYSSSINTNVVSKDKPFFITKNIIAEGIEKSLREDENIILRQNVLSVKANGYILRNPIGKKASSIEIRSFTDAISKEIAGKIDEIVKLSFPNSQIHYHTLIQSIFPDVVRITSKKDFLFIYPEYETSEFILVRNGTVESGLSVPFGKNTLIRSLSERMNKGFNPALSMLDLYINGQIEGTAKIKMDEMLLGIQGEFQDFFKNVIWRLSSTVFVPKNIVIFGNCTCSNLLKKWISIDPWISGVQNSVDVSLIDEKAPLDSAHIDNSVADVPPALVSTALYLASLD